MRAIPINRTDYCQFLTISQTNYSLTYYAEHARKCSHDVINRFLDNEKYTPSLLWEHIKDDVELSENGYVIFDDTVLAKRNTKKIAKLTLCDLFKRCKQDEINCSNCY